MPPQIALILCVVFIAALYIRDKRERPMPSWGSWLALIWFVIIGSRPVSAWFGQGGGTMDDPSLYLEGSPFDRNVFLALILGGLAALLTRSLDWRRVFAGNRLFFAFIAYCLLAVLWSDYPFVSFKRWTKELGNIIMVLILLSEKDPLAAMKAVVGRFTYIVIPVSVLFIKYFPNLGRYYNNYTWTVGHGGITTNKNQLGAILVMCGLYLVWDLLQLRAAGKDKNRIRRGVTLALLVMTLWLFKIAHSSTALVCFALGTGLLLFLRLPFVRRQIRLAALFALIGGSLVLLVYSMPGVKEAIFGVVGRDTTFTGRTELWTELLRTSINSLTGTGYQSFWLGLRAEQLWAKFSFHPNQAHNGYLETYLNLGVIGLGLLLAFIVSAFARLGKELTSGDDYAILRFSFFVAAVATNWTEAMFNTQSVIWIMMIIAIMEYRPAPKPVFAARFGEGVWLRQKQFSHEESQKL